VISEPDQFAVGMLGTDASTSQCLSSFTPGVQSDPGQCDGSTLPGAFGAGFASYSPLGGLGAYAVVSDADTVRLGTNGQDVFTLSTSAGINAYAKLSMNGNKITNLATGTIASASTDAVTGGQLYLLSTTVSTNISTVSSRVTSLSTGLSTVTSNVASLSTGVNSLSSIVASVSTGVSSLSTGAVSMSTGITSLSTALNDTVRYDNSAHTAVTLGGQGGAPVTLTNVAAGAVALSSLDAVNGGQLYGLATSMTTALGGNASVDANGNVVAPSYALDGSTYNNVGDALANLDGRVSNNTVNINNGGGGIKYFHANSTLNDSSATGSDAVAIGGNAIASFANCVALGSNSVTDRPNSVSVGAPGAERQITNLAAGSSPNDAVNVAQLDAAMSGGSANAVTYDDPGHTSVTLHAANSTAPVALKNIANGTVDGSSLDAVNGSQLFGTAASTAAALGGGASVDSDGKITPPSYTFKDSSTYNTVGGALTNLDDRVTQNTTDITNINSTLNDITTGGGIKYFHANSTLADSSATGAESVAIGGNAQALANNSVAIGSNSVADRANTVSVGAAGAERQITNVATGTKDTDAVNVSQIKAAGLVNTDGSANTALTYGHQADGSTDYANVTLGDGSGSGTMIHNLAAGTADNDAVNVGQMNAALDRVANAVVDQNPMFDAHGDRATEAASATGAHATAMGANAKATAANSVALGANSVADRDDTVSVGSVGNERQITNVRAGTASTGAANVGQLNMALAQSQSYTDSRIAGVQSQVNNVARTAYGGIAAAMAVAGLPQPTDPGKTMVAMAAGRYAGASGAAIGVSHVTQDNRWVVKLSGNTSNSGNVGFTIGAGHQW